MTNNLHDVWAAGELYEPYVGRWSRLVAKELLLWLAVPPQKDWLDVGCGTGVLSHAILHQADPRILMGIDSSPTFVEYAKASIQDPRASFKVDDGHALSFNTASFDVVTSGLALNFLGRQGIAEMARVVRPGGIVAAYVWDYADKMEMMRHFWNAAVALDLAASELDEARRFPNCRPGPLESLFTAAALHQVQVRAIDVRTDFRDFDDYWTPFLGGQGPAPGYAMSLNQARREALRERIRTNLPIAEDGSIHLIARAWAVSGRA